MGPRASAPEGADLLGGAPAARERARDGTRFAVRVGGFAGEEQRVLEQLREPLAGAAAAGDDMALGAAGNGVGLPVVQVAVDGIRAAARAVREQPFETTKARLDGGGIVGAREPRLRGPARLGYGHGARTGSIVHNVGNAVRGAWKNEASA